MNRRSVLRNGLIAATTLVMPGWVNASRTDDSLFSLRDMTDFLGVQSYSFRDFSLDEAIAAMKMLGITSCELFEGHVAPEGLIGKREEIKQWRSSVKVDHFLRIREKFTKNDIRIQAYTANFKDNVTDEELESIFSMTRVLGTQILTTSATVSLMKRVDPFAVRHDVIVGMHNHDHSERPNEFSTPETFERGMNGLSPNIKINLDIGHATAANYDPLGYLEKMHEKIVCIHIKDRKKDHGPRTPFGEGDTPIAAILRSIRDNNWNIPANIELEYPGDTMTSMKHCVEYCRKILQS